MHTVSKSSVRKAGKALRAEASSGTDRNAALEVLSAWRSMHALPLNTFQTYIRSKLSKGRVAATVAQRLKRTPSIIKKLARYDGMDLDRMQDIGGVRAVFDSIPDVYKFYDMIIASDRFKHIPVIPCHDYIKHPKDDGYRSLHQVFKYKSEQHPELDDLRIEVQLRTRAQHCWATAIETLDAIMHSSFKTGEGDDAFKRYFKLASALFAIVEETPVPSEFSSRGMNDIADELSDIDNTLHISDILLSFVVQMSNVDIASKKSSGYQLMELDAKKKRLSVTTYTLNQLELAEDVYALRERKTRDNPDVSVVLVSAGNLENIRKAYPNYFLDSTEFLAKLSKFGVGR